MRTFVYVDGFNLYYGCLKGTPYKWLDLAALFPRILRPEHQVLRVKYFTARISARPGDPSGPSRQDAYLRALRAHCPSVEPIFGRFTVKPKRMPCAYPPPNTIEVLFTEEKGSDVNLAAHMVHDGCTGAYDCAVVVSNDSDLEEAARIVATSLGKRVLQLVPGDPAVRKPSAQLSRWCKASKHILAADLVAAQLPDPIPGTSIRKPASW